MMAIDMSSLTSSLTPIVLIAAAIGLLVILIVYLYSKYANDNRYSAWAKIEVYQLGVSLIAFGTMLILINLICTSGYFSDFAKILGFKSTGEALSFKGAAENYLKQSAVYSYNVFTSAEYFYAAYSVASRYTAYLCGNSMGGAQVTAPGPLNKVNCIMGSSIGAGGGAGIYVSPMAGYGTYMSVVSFISNGALMSFFTNITSYFLLEFSFSGMLLFLFPLGLLIRMIPFSRRIGAALMSIGFAFIFVYPLVLSVFYIDYSNAKILFNTPQVLKNYKTKSIENAAVSPDVMGEMWANLAVKKIEGKTPTIKDFVQLASTLAHSFLLSFFIPMLAFVITIGSLNYMLSLLGVELDLSRLLQMV